MKYKQTFTLKDLLFQRYIIKHLYKLWIKLYKIFLKKQSRVLKFLKVFQSDTDCRDCVTFSSRPKGTWVGSLLYWEFEVRNCQDKIYKKKKSKEENNGFCLDTGCTLFDESKTLGWDLPNHWGQGGNICLNCECFWQADVIFSYLSLWQFP